MFDVGFTELLLIGIVSLVVIGPERLPDVARTVGKWIGKTQRFVRGVKTDIANELDSGELKKLIGDQREQIDELRKVVGSTRRDLEATTKDVVRGARKKLTELEDAAARSDAADDGASDETPAARTSGARTPPTGNAVGGGAAGAPTDGSTDGSTGGPTGERVPDADAPDARTTSSGATPADGADAAARAIGRASESGRNGTSDGSEAGTATGTSTGADAGASRTDAEASAPRPAVQVDGQVVGDTHGSANEATPDDDVRQSGSRS